MLDSYGPRTTWRMTQGGPGWCAAPPRRTPTSRRITGLAIAGILAALSGCTIPRDIATDDESGAAATSQSERAPATLAAPPQGDFSIVSGQPIETPCWSYEGPQNFVNNISSDGETLCLGALELWGEVIDGVVVPTGVGAVYGQVKVEPVRVSTSDAWGAGRDLDGAVDALADSYFAENGTIISLHEQTVLDGVPANITRVEGGIKETRTKAFITAFAPEPFTPGDSAVQFFVIGIVTPYENGDELIEQVVSTWRWA